MIKHGTAEAYRDRAFFVLRHGAVEVVLCISIADMQLGELGLLENTQETETLQILNVCVFLVCGLHWSLLQQNIKRIVRTGWLTTIKFEWEKR